MALLRSNITTYSDGSVLIKEYTPEPIPSTVQLYQVLEDVQIFGSVRSCAPCPAVITLHDDPHNFVSEQWQYYIRAINYNQALRYVVANYDYGLAYCNGTGFGDPSDPRANYYLRQNLDQKPPQFDKVRTNTRNVLTGTEIYNVTQAMRDTKNVLQAFLWSKKGTLGDVRQALISQNVLKVQTFDSTVLPPLKEGRSYPQSLSEINPDDYLYMPQYNREMFLVMNIVNKAGELVPFDNGALYPWTEEPNTPYAFFPHISNPKYGDVLYPLRFLKKLPIGSPVPSPYRRN